MQQKFDLAVIGSGVMGTFHAYHAALKGLSVIVFEKDLRPMEATVRNFGQVVPSGFPPGRWHYYGRYSTQLYKEVQEKKDIGIRNNGSVYIASNDGEMQLIEELHRSFAEVDYPSVLLTKEQVLDRWPSVRSDYVKGAIFFEQEVSSESRRMIHQLQAYLSEQYNITFKYSTPVCGLEDSGTAVKVEDTLGNITEADQVVVANGRDFKLLFPEQFASSNIEVTKLAMMVTQPLPEIYLKGNILTGLTIRRYESFTQLPSYGKLDPTEVNQEAVDNGIHILFKQRTDGSIVIGDSHHYADAANADELGFDIDMDVNRILLDEAKKIVDLPSWEIRDYWNGFYAQMKGGEEIYERSVSDRIHISTAIGGKGMTACAGYAKERIDKIFALAQA